MIEASPNQLNHLDLLSGLMRRFAETGDAVDGLQWALPYVLETLSAEAGSLFLHRPGDAGIKSLLLLRAFPKRTEAPIATHQPHHLSLQNGA